MVIFVYMVIILGLMRKSEKNRKFDVRSMNLEFANAN